MLKPMHGTYEIVDDRSALTFQRRLAHSVERVWRAVTEPAELAHWFPSAMSGDLRPGGTLTFEFPDGEMPTMQGEVIEVDPPRCLAFTWGDDVLRIELEPDADGCVLHLVVLFDDAQRASRDAAVKQIRGQGFEPVSLADYKTGQSLRVIVGKPKKSTGVRGRRAFFFVRRDYLGTDAASPSLRVRVLRQRDGVITLGYRLYLSGDKPSDPSGELAKVRFTISDGRLVPQDQIPPAASRLPPS